MNIDWNQLRVFTTVAEVGGFTGAGKVPGLSQSAISRQISTLEGAMGVLPFRRHASGVLLTEPGIELQSTVADMSSRLALASERINENRETPKGALRITTSATFGSAWLSAHGIYRAVLSGLGIAAPPYYPSEETPGLMQVLPEFQGPIIEAFFVYPEKLRLFKRIEVLRDFLFDKIKSYKKSRAKAATQ